MWAVWSFAEDVLPEDLYEIVWVSASGRAQQIATDGDWVTVAAGAVAVVAIGLAGGLFASAVWSVVLFYGLTLSRSGELAGKLWTARLNSLRTNGSKFARPFWSGWVFK